MVSASSPTTPHRLPAIMRKRQRGKPGMIINDNGTELTCSAVLAWCSEAGISWHHIAPGKPMQNGYAASINGRMRANSSTNPYS